MPDDQQRPAPAGRPAPDGVLIRPMTAADAGPVLAIYQAGLDTGQASFETAAPPWAAFDATRLPAHRHVAADAATGAVLGWVAASAVSSRCVYAGVIEHSVYVQPGQHGRGIGAALLAELVRSTEEAGIWTIQSGVFPENTTSLRLHERAGFRVVGLRERLGCHYGRWRDVLLIERRSGIAGRLPAPRRASPPRAPAAAAPVIRQGIRRGIRRSAGGAAGRARSAGGARAAGRRTFGGRGTGSGGQGTFSGAARRPHRRPARAPRAPT